MTVENDKAIMWKKISTLPQPEDEWMDPEYSISKRFALAKYLHLTPDEVDKLIDGYSSERE